MYSAPYNIWHLINRLSIHVNVLYFYDRQIRFFYHTQYPYPKKNNKRRQQQEAHTKFKPWVKKCYGTENNVNYPQRL